MFSRRASAPPLRARLVLVFVLSLSAWQRGLDKFGDDDDVQVFSQTHGVIVASNPHASVVGFGPCFTHAAKPPVLDTHPAFTANGTTKRHAFHENDVPVSLTSPELHAGAGANKGGAPLVLALVRLTNPVDAPLERLDVTNTYRVWLDTHLPIYATAQAHVASERGKVGPGVDVLAVTQTAADPLMWRGRVFCEIDEAAGVLTFSAPLFRGESTLDANDAPSTHALRDALRNVTYVHSGKNPDGAVRGVEFVVVDALGIESAPSAVLIDVFPINDPPTLDLNGVHQPGKDIVVSFGENERNLGVMLTSAAVSIGDPDGDLLARCFVKYDPQGGDTADFPDGDAERIVAVVMGTSVTSYWNRTTLTLELKGVDTLDAYMGVLATTRYTHSGLVVDVPNRTRATAFLEFTAGQRNFVITVEDTDGATANASVSVDVQDVIRVGRPSRDENQANPEECSGYGSTKLTIVRALSPAQDLNQPTPLYDPEECVCDPGHEGDSCEIFGDPHVSGFDNSGHEIPGYLGLLSFGAYQRAAHPIDVNVYDVGDFWLVRSADLQIQSRFANSKDFVPDRPAVGAIAISGPLLDNKLLSIQPLDMAVNWDGQQLSEAPLDANVTSGSLNIRSHDGPDGTRVLEVQLPMGVNFRAVRFLHHIDAKVTLPRSFIGQVDGLCGNRNGLAEDDAEETVANRMHSIAVSPDERLLPF